MPKISIIIPVFNTEKYLSRCLDSILAQTVSDYEVIIVNDGSTDLSGSICEQYAQQDSRFIVFHQENKGQAAARNLALDWIDSNSDSEYITFIDSDDWVHPQYLELLLAAIMETDGISTGRIQSFQTMEEINIQRLSEVHTIKTPEFIYTHGENTVYAYVCGSLYTRSIWKSLRFPAGRRWEDLSIYHKALFQAPRIAWFDIPLYYYFQNSDGTTLSEWKPWKMDFIRALQGLLQDSQILERKQIFDILISLYIRNCFRLLTRLSTMPEHKKAASYLRVSLRKGLWKYRSHPECSFRTNRKYYYAAFPYLLFFPRKMSGIKDRIFRRFSHDR